MHENNGLTEPDVLHAEHYPWHRREWGMLAGDLQRLPHALLLCGQPGLGKHAFAQRLAHALLCAQPGAEREACGHCQSCRLFKAGNHPDFFPVEPLEEGRPIGIDQVRALRDFLVLRAHTAAHKVVVLSPADAMNLNAANGLLKLLEEPPPGNFILLVTSRPARLPATIRSRCMRVLFSSPSRSEALTWLRSRQEVPGDHKVLLELAGGAPLLAVHLARHHFLAHRDQLLQDMEALHARREEPVACAARWKKLGAEACLSWLYGFVGDLIKAGMMEDSRAAPLANPDLHARLQPLVKSLKLKKLFEFLDVVSELKQQLSGPLEERLILEDVLIRWCRAAR